MNRSIPWLLASAVAIAPAVVVTTYTPRADAQIVVYPPAAYVAAYSPYYYNGHPHYFYRNSWYYRDGGGWHGYDREPGALYNYRGNWGGHRYGGWGGHGHGRR